MIKTAITGGHTRRAGELIRILINHPDVVIKAIHTPAPMLANRPVADFHRGLVGDTDLIFDSAPFSPDGIDVVFITGTDIPANLDQNPDLKVINLTRTPVEGYVYGLPELNRKPLVRGALRANVPSASATAVLLSLLPLAKNLLLIAPIDVRLSLGTTDATLFPLRENEIEDALRSLQSSFKAPVNMTIETNSTRQRVTTATVTTTVGATLQQARELFTDYYDDHNLTHIVVDRLPIPDDVIGTAKALISVDSIPEDTDPTTLTVTTALDAPIKGSAGQAVHIMNLLTRLHEKTGLALKSAAY